MPRRTQTTLKDVALSLGMHKSTISLALSGKGTLAEETRHRIRQTAREMGYAPNPLAQRLARGVESNTVCILSGDLDVGISTEKILRIQKALGGEGFETPLHICPSLSEEGAARQASQIRSLCDQRPLALVCAVQRFYPQVLAELERYSLRGGVLVCYDTPVALGCDQVVFDREENAYRAARFVLDAGHRTIGLGMSPPTQPGNPADPPVARLRGFRRALDEFGVRFRPEWDFRNSLYEPGGVALARQFLALAERPTALAIVNDYVALAFMTEVIRAGVRIPEDLSVIGHDNQPIAAFCPVPLTSATQPIERIAVAVVERLKARLDGEDDPPKTVSIAGEIVERGSVACPA